jgi:hypothetical protein
MAKFKVYGQVVGSKYLGEVEANSKEEAEIKGGNLDECYVSLCHQCSRECDDPQIGDIEVVRQEEGD